MQDAAAAAAQLLEGANLNPSWLAACAAHIAGSGIPGFGSLPAPQRAKLLLQQLLQSDLHTCGAPSLPQGVQGLHDTTLRGKFLLQVDEVVNIGAAVKERYSGNDGSGRCLKLLLTDGVQQVAAMEYRPTPALHSTMPAGCKLVVRDAAVRRGMLLLTPQNCSVLGGSVAALEAARQRMVAHWMRPAVGRRGPPPSMKQATAEATQAAWAEGPMPGAVPPRPLSPQQVGQGPTAAMQQQQGPPPHQQQQQTGLRPSQQPTQLLSQQQQQQRQAPLVQAGGAASGRMQAQGPAVPAASLQPRAVQGRPEHQLPGAGRGVFGPAVGQGSAQQQQEQQRTMGSGSSGRMVAQQGAPAPEAALPAAPLQELNGASSGARKRSRLALPKPPGGQQEQLSQQAAQQQQQQQQEQQQQQPAAPVGAAAFGFAQPPQQQQPGLPQHAPQRVQARVQPQLLQRLRQAAAAGPAAAGGGLGTGTAQDPICLDEDVQDAEQGSGQASQAGTTAPAAAVVKAEADVEMGDAEQKAAGDDWGADDDDWEDEPPSGRGHMDPWEQGFDEEQLPDADADAPADGVGGSGWEEDGAVKEAAADLPQQGQDDAGEDQGWEAGEGAEGGGEEGGGAGAAAGAAGGSDDGWEEDMIEEEAQQPQRDAAGCGSPPPAAAVARPSEAAQHARQRSSGRTAEQLLPPQQLPRQRQQLLKAAASVESSSQPIASAACVKDMQKPLPSAAPQQGAAAAAPPPPKPAASAGVSHVASSGTMRAQERTVAAQAQPVQQPPPQQQQPQLGAAPGDLGVPEAALVEPLDPSLLDVAPTLAEVLYAKQPATAGPASGSPASAHALPSMPSLKPAVAGPDQPRVHPAGAHAPPPAAAAVRPEQGQAARRAAVPAIAAVGADSDEDMPSFGLLDDLSPARQLQQEAAAGGGGGSPSEEPFTYLLHLASKAASADASQFPLNARILATVKTFVGKLQFRDPQTGQPQYGMEMQVEDGSMVARAALGHLFMREFFEMEPPELEACLSDPARRGQAAELVKGLQSLLACYCGLMEVRLEGPGERLQVVNILLEGMSEEQVEAFQQRATGGAGG